MAEFNTKCPHCNAELVADEDWIGMEVECPTCKQTFIVAKETPKLPKLSMPQIKPETPTANTNEGDAETSFTFICPECETQAELPIALKGTKYECKACCEESIAEPATEKKCPHCGQKIKLHATICKHCKKHVDISANQPISQSLAPVPNQATFSLQQKIKNITKYCTPASNRESLIAILWGASILMWIVSIICCFINGILGLILFLIAFLLSVTSLLLKKSESFELLPDEQILSTCRLVDEEDDVTHFTRLTNKRIVLSAIEYPFLPHLIGLIIEGIAKPKRITYACEWDKVIRIETELKGTVLKIKRYHTVLETSDITYHFKPAPKLVDFWETRKGNF